MNKDYGSPRELSRSSLSQPSTEEILLIDMFKLSSMEEKQEFGLVHLGEALNIMLILTNDVPNIPIKDATIQLEIQTGTQRFTLQSLEGLEIGSFVNWELTTKLEIKELGVHVISCNVTFKIDDGQAKVRRKFYKFNAVAPFQLRTKVNESLFNVDGRIFVEAQLINCSSAMATFEIQEISFDPHPAFTARTITSDERALAGLSNISISEATEEEPAASYSNISTLQPRCSYLFVFELTPISIKDLENLTLGRLDIKWATATGEVGKLQTGNLFKKQTLPEVLSVSCIPPSHLYLNCPAELALKFTNNSNRVVNQISISFDAAAWKDDSVFVPIGAQHLRISQLFPGDSVTVLLKAIPVQAGLLTCRDFWLEYVDEQVLHRLRKEFQFFIEYESI